MWRSNPFFTLSGLCGRAGCAGGKQGAGFKYFAVLSPGRAVHECIFVASDFYKLDMCEGLKCRTHTRSRVWMRPPEGSRRTGWLPKKQPLPLGWVPMQIQGSRRGAEGLRGRVAGVAHRRRLRLDLERSCHAARHFRTSPRTTCLKPVTSARAPWTLGPNEIRK